MWRHGVAAGIRPNPCRPACTTKVSYSGSWQSNNQFLYKISLHEALLRAPTGREVTEDTKTHQIVVVFHVWGAAVKGLPLDAKDGVNLFRVHVVRAGGQAIPEGLVVVMRHVVTPPEPPSWPHVGRQT